MLPLDLTPFHQLATQQQRLAKEALRIYTGEVAAIVRSRCTDRNRIEHQLDGILGFCFDDDMLRLFKILCRYYYRIDPTATAEYDHIYREMWDEQHKPDDE